jgi:MFS family permease
MKLGSKINGQATTASGSKIAFAFRALNSRNYRLFFSGQLVSLIGTWMAITTTTWLVFSLTHNAWLMGLSAFIGQVPTFILGPFTGVVVDRIDKKKLLLATQTGAMLQTFILAFLTLTHQVTYMDIVVLNALSGIVNAFDMPTRQSLMVRLVDRKEDLSGAIAMNSSMVNVGRLIGPTIGGLVIASFGEGICYVANGVSFLAVIGSILMIRLASDPSQIRKIVISRICLRAGVMRFHRSPFAVSFCCLRPLAS